MRRWFLAIALVVAVIVLSIFAPDDDYDGVINLFDQCKNTAQLKKVEKDFRYHMVVSERRLKDNPGAWPVNFWGCEYDTDGDGVRDSLDYCPEDTAEMIEAGVSENGCPMHSDMDGTPDYRDRCPDTPRGVKTDKNGCPV